MFELQAGGATVRQHSGAFKPGQDHPNAKLLAADVSRLFDLHRQGKGPTEIAALLGVQKACVSRIINGHRRWRERVRWMFEEGQ